MNSDLIALNKIVNGKRKTVGQAAVKSEHDRMDAAMERQGAKVGEERIEKIRADS